MIRENHKPLEPISFEILTRFLGVVFYSRTGDIVNVIEGSFGARARAPNGGLSIFHKPGKKGRVFTARATDESSILFAG